MNESSKSEPALAVTRSMLPPMADMVRELEEVWAGRWLTNAGPKVRAFEAALARHLETDRVLTYTNGGAALIAGIRALNIEPGSEVVTTPFTFPGTTHCLALNRLTPVFADIDPQTLNLDPRCAERAIGPRTRAILAVHVFGTPCDVEAFETLGRDRNLAVIYDGAHAFGVRRAGRSLAAWGDVQMFSFNATKVLTTGEGGCVVFRDPRLDPILRRLRRWDMLEEGDVTLPGFNGMMTEWQAALSLCNLRILESERAGRRRAIAVYRERLARVEGVRLPPKDPPDTEPALSYFVVRIGPGFGVPRDAVLERLRAGGVSARRYFYPLVPRLAYYRDLPSAAPGLHPVAEQVAEEVLSLPLHGDLSADAVHRVCDLIESTRA